MYMPYYFQIEGEISGIEIAKNLLNKPLYCIKQYIFPPSHQTSNAQIFISGNMMCTFL